MNYRPEEPDAHLVAKKRQYAKKKKQFKTIVIAIICITIVAVWILIGWTAYKLSETYNPKKDKTKAETTTALEINTTITPEKEQTPDSFYGSSDKTKITIPRSQIYSGSLIIVKNEEDRAYRATDVEFLNVFNTQTEFAVKPYKMSNSSHRLEKDAFYAFDEMLGAFYNANGQNRNYQLRMSLFDEPNAACTDEHLTGYAVDLNVYDGKTSYTLQKDAPEVYNWIYDHAAEYGFILRYPDSDFDHFRYIGKGHSAYVVENGLSLEDYVGLLQRHTYDKEHLLFTQGGIAYECFYVHFADGTESVDIEIPSGVNYTLSGDNVSGVIVTLY